MYSRYISKTLFALLALSALLIIECNSSTIVSPKVIADLESVVLDGDDRKTDEITSITKSDSLSELNAASNQNDTSSKVLESTSQLMDDIVHEVEPSKSETLWRKITGALKDTVAPFKSYYSLIQRYHHWFGKYDALRKNLGEEYMPLSSMEMFRQEYALADEYLMAEKCIMEPIVMKEHEDDPIEEAEKVENMDFVFKALNLVIEQLEARLKDFEASGQVESENDLGDEEEDEEVDYERVKAAMDRLKRTFINQAKNIATGELLNVAQTAAYGSAALFVVQHLNGAENMRILAPLVELAVARASAPLAISYLRSLEYRAIVGVFNAVNPVPDLIERCVSRWLKVKRKEKPLPSM